VTGDGKRRVDNNRLKKYTNIVLLINNHRPNAPFGGEKGSLHLIDIIPEMTTNFCESISDDTLVLKSNLWSVVVLSSSTAS